MNEHEAYEIICKQLGKEIGQIAEQIQKNNTMSIQDLEKLDKMYHLKKSMKTVKAMEDSEEYLDGGFSGENQNGNSGYRGRAMNGRFVSRSAGSNSYSDGYAKGYSEAMNQMNGNSGHYIPYYDEPRRW